MTSGRLPSNMILAALLLTAAHAQANTNDDVQCQLEVSDPWTGSDGTHAGGRIHCSGQMQWIWASFYLEVQPSKEADWIPIDEERYCLRDQIDTGQLSFIASSSWCSHDSPERIFRTRVQAFFKGPNGEHLEGNAQTYGSVLPCP